MSDDENKSKHQTTRGRGVNFMGVDRGAEREGNFDAVDLRFGETSPDGFSPSLKGSWVLMISNLSPSTTEDDLRVLLEKIDPTKGDNDYDEKFVTVLRLHVGAKTAECIGHAFVSTPRLDWARKIQSLNGSKFINDLPVAVNFAFQVSPGTSSATASTFDLDAFKREYTTNEDTRNAVTQWLWNTFDKNYFTMWFCTYKYNEELSQIFITSGLISGWFARMESCRKMAFGTALILGTNNSHELVGFWIFRSTTGSELPELVKNVDDCENFEWRQITDFDEKEKDLVADFLCWDGTHLPKPCIEGRTFK